MLDIVFQHLSSRPYCPMLAPLSALSSTLSGERISSDGLCFTNSLLKSGVIVSLFLPGVTVHQSRKSSSSSIFLLCLVILL